MQGTDIFKQHPEAYRAFMAASTHENTVKYLKKKLYALYNKKEAGKFVIIDIGCGNGKRMIPVLEFLQQFGGCKVYAVDSSQALLDEYKETVEKKGIHHIQFVAEDWMNWTPPEKADVIVAVHSLYYIMFEEALKKAVEWIKDDGTVCVGFRSQEKGRNVIADVQRAVALHIPHVPNLFLESPYHMLEQLGLENQTDVVTEKLDLRPCKEMTEEGKNIIEFLLMQPIEHMDAKVKEAVQMFFLQQPDTGPLEDVFLWLRRKE